MSPKEIALTVPAERDKIAARGYAERETARGVDVVKGTGEETDKSAREKRLPSGQFKAA